MPLVLLEGEWSHNTFRGNEGTEGFELAAGVGASGGELESNAWTGRSLTADQPSGSRVSPRSKARGYACRLRVVVEDRHGMAAEVHKINRRRKNPARRVSE
jgi:hypothetical protein